MGFSTMAANRICYYINEPGCIIVDLRDASDYSKGHIPSAINIPSEKLDTDCSRLNGYKIIVLYCSRGNTSLLAAKNLKISGAQIINVYGGIHAYRGELEKGYNNI